jgi:hypothetical protein
MTDNDLCMAFVQHQHRCGLANDYDLPLPPTRCGDLLTALKPVDCAYGWPILVHFFTSKETEEQKSATRKKIGDEYNQCRQHDGQLTPTYTGDHQGCDPQWDALEACMQEKQNRLDVISCHGITDNWDYRVKCCKVCERAMGDFRACLVSVPSYGASQFYNPGGSPQQASGRQDKGGGASSRPAADGNSVSDFFRSGGAR